MPNWTLAALIVIVSHVVRCPKNVVCVYILYNIYEIINICGKNDDRVSNRSIGRHKQRKAESEIGAMLSKNCSSRDEFVINARAGQQKRRLILSCARTRNGEKSNETQRAESYIRAFAWELPRAYWLFSSRKERHVSRGTSSLARCIVLRAAIILRDDALAQSGFFLCVRLYTYLPFVNGPSLRPEFFI